MPPAGANGLRQWAQARMMPLVGRLLRFGLVGGLATVTHGTVAYASLRWLAAPPVLANVIGFCVAVVVSFCGHALFTFRTEMTAGRAVRFVTVALSSVALSSMVVLGFQYGTPMRPEVYLPLTALVTPVFNFTCHTLWTFRQARGIVD